MRQAMQKQVAITVLLLTILASLWNGTGFAAANWESKSPWPTRETMYDVTYGGGLFVAVGGDNDIWQTGSSTIATSPDGQNWSKYNVQPPVLLRGVAYGNNMYVVVGGNGNIFTSPDGVNWTNKVVDDTTFLSVAYGGGKFVAVQLDGGIMVSSDGLDWTTANIQNSNRLTDITYGGGWFVAVGDKATRLVSQNGTNWTVSSGNTSETYNSVTFANNRFVIVAYQNAIYSQALPNSTWTWTNVKDTQSLPNYAMSAVSYGSGKFVAVGYSGSVYTSTSGTGGWSRSASGFNFDLNSIAYGNGRFVAIGVAGLFLTSTDGLTWKNNLKYTVSTMSSMQYINGQFFGTANYEGLWSSVDGETWKKILADNGDGVIDLAYGNGIYVMTTFQGSVWVSSDAVTWKNYKPSNISGNLYRVSYGSGKFVAVTTSNKIWTSSNGITWSAANVPVSQSLYGVAYADQQFVAVGTGGTILTSTDGSNWAIQISNTISSLYGIAYGNDLWIATGESGTILTSKDGLSWSPQTSPTNATLQSAAFGKGGFVLVGTKATILSSKDAKNWTADASGLSARVTLSGVAYGNGIYVAGGETGAILKMTPSLDSTISPVTATFDRYASSTGYQDITIQMDLNDATLNGISNAGTALVPNVDYSVQGSTVVIDKAYLAKQNVGSTTLEFAFSSGSNQNLAISIVDTSPAIFNVVYAAGDHGQLDGATSEKVTSGMSPVAVPVIKPASGYRFAGWSSDNGISKLSSQQVLNTLVTSDLTYTAYYMKLLMGDADGDGKVTSNDALLLKKYITGQMTLTPEQLQALDINGDGKWDDLDVKAILAIAAGKG